MTDLLFFRVIVVAVFSATSYFQAPFGLGSIPAAALGACIAALLVLLDARLRRENAPTIAGAAVGALTGLLIAYLFALTVSHIWTAGTPTVYFVDLTVLAAGLYLGIRLGAEKGGAFRIQNTAVVTSNSFLALDTSVIIDGRIADIAETGFLDGQLAVPRFVMRELQAVADSADGAKRNRGRRGLDILQRIQKIPNMDVRILEDDFPGIPEVDLKLLELAKRYGCKVVTNDFNLNKVAQVHKVAVLNVNELANALKPVVLPGEWMRVYILKEGKELGQGVAYLDDGTMVVVDNARRLIGRTIDISVTSVLQTTAGKMIFARFDEKQHAVHEVKAPLPATGV